jgi:ribonuclease T1
MAVRSLRLLVPAALAAAIVACTGAPVAPSAPTPPATLAVAIENASGLPTIRLAELPSEALATVILIMEGGPYPYQQDGAVFENREGILPDEPAGWYHEYTVPTPGSDDRGARRIVTGADGAMFWTEDHYDSFSWIER